MSSTTCTADTVMNLAVSMTMFLQVLKTSFWQLKKPQQFTILYSQTLLLVAWDIYSICLPKTVGKYGHNYKLHLAGYKSYFHFWDQQNPLEHRTLLYWIVSNILHVSTQSVAVGIKSHMLTWRVSIDFQRYNPNQIILSLLQQVIIPEYWSWKVLCGITELKLCNCLVSVDSIANRINL